MRCKGRRRSTKNCWRTHYLVSEWHDHAHHQVLRWREKCLHPRPPKRWRRNDWWPGFFRGLSKVALAWALDTESMYIAKWRLIQVTVQLYIQFRRVKVQALLDCGVTENFIHPRLVKKLKLKMKLLKKPRQVKNVNSTTNKAEAVTKVAILEIRCKGYWGKHAFFVVEVDCNEILLGYLFLEAVNPEIILHSESTPTFSSLSYTYSTPDTWDMPPPSPTIVSKFLDVISAYPLDILPYVASEPFCLDSLLWSWPYDSQCFTDFYPYRTDTDERKLHLTACPYMTYVHTLKHETFCFEWVCPTHFPYGGNRQAK